LQRYLKSSYEPKACDCYDPAEQQHLARGVTHPLAPTLLLLKRCCKLLLRALQRQ
jgi:hypothetical protein